ncbi:MAG: SWFGD domain-containing protein, partial [Hymenobacteraceae bacterium]|nr:SWFGD domain-containing protein [Hymenobacteraceae bacterium]MDX5396603.1 SWFGD domain-containing protein [Hymenobacteraceae bacterium]MDX5512666.1 SWFGD domain-containing protein [Hymenobacteraceae bacterium]
DRAGDKISHAWNRMTNDYDNDYNSDWDRSNRYNRTSGSWTGSTYNNRYGTSNYQSDYDRDNDRGFFERAGDEVKSWFGDEDAERRRRRDEMRDRDDWNTSSRYTRTGTRNYSGPPYNYGSSSRRDYEW